MSNNVRPMKIGEKIWNDTFEALGERTWKVYAILAEAFTMFAQAVQCFDAGVGEGKSLLFRATLESAFFLFLIKKWSDNGSIELNMPTTLDGEIRRVEFAELAKAIMKKVAFSDKQSKAINRIQEHGNLAAHFASRKTEKILKLTQEFGKERELVDESKLNLQDRIKAIYERIEKFELWISLEQALEDLRDTASILLTLFNATPYPNKT